MHQRRRATSSKGLQWELRLALLECEEFRAAVGLPPLGVPLTQDQIAAVLGCTRQTVSNIERAALRRLRNDEACRQLAIAEKLIRA